MKIAKAILPVSLALSMSSAVAQTYAGAEGGAAFVDLNAQSTAQTIANATGQTTTVRYDRSALAGRAFIGEKLNDTLALEVGAFIAGSLKANYANALGTASESYDAKGLDLSVKARIPDTGIFVRGGVHYSEVRGSAFVTLNGTTYASTGTRSGTGFLAGVGYEDKLGAADDLFWSIEYRYMNRIGGESDVNANLLTMGIRKNF